MKISFCKVGPIRTNCYLVEDDSGCMMIDPGDDASTLIDLIGDRKLDLIVLTHWHDDHIAALAEVAKATGAKVAASRIDAEKIKSARRGAVESFDMLFSDGDEFDVGSVHFVVYHTPGHTEGSICLYSEENKVLFSGDTLFAGNHGRTDFPGGSYPDMVESLKRLGTLPDDVDILPGHESFSNMKYEQGWLRRL